jgi:hypothetical protein
MGQIAGILQIRGQLEESLRIRREEVLPVYERLGEVRLLLVGRANLALALLERGQPDDMPEIIRLLALALQDARRLRSPETERIAAIIREIGHDPDAPPFA